MIILNPPAFLSLNQSGQIPTEVKENNSVNFSKHQQWDQENGGKNILNNLRLIVQPPLLFWSLYLWLDLLPNDNL